MTNPQNQSKKTQKEIQMDRVKAAIGDLLSFCCFDNTEENMAMEEVQMLIEKIVLQKSEYHRQKCALFNKFKETRDREFMRRYYDLGSFSVYTDYFKVDKSVGTFHT